MNLKQFFLLLFLVTNFQNNIFCSSEFEKFQQKCTLPTGMLWGGGLMVGMGMCVLGMHITSQQTNGVIFNTKTKDSISLSAIFLWGLGMTFYGAAALSAVHNQYKEKINAK